VILIVVILAAAGGGFGYYWFFMQDAKPKRVVPIKPPRPAFKPKLPPKSKPKPAPKKKLQPPKAQSKSWMVVCGLVVVSLGVVGVWALGYLDNDGFTRTTTHYDSHGGGKGHSITTIQPNLPAKAEVQAEPAKKKDNSISAIVSNFVLGEKEPDVRAAASDAAPAASDVTPDVRTVAAPVPVPGTGGVPLPKGIVKIHGMLYHNNPYEDIAKKVVSNRPQPGKKVQGIYQHMNPDQEIIVPSLKALQNPHDAKSNEELGKATYYLGGKQVGDDNVVMTCLPFDREGNWINCPVPDGLSENPRDYRGQGRAWSYNQEHYDPNWATGMKDDCSPGKNKAHPYAPKSEGGEGLDDTPVSKGDFPDKIQFVS